MLKSLISLFPGGADLARRFSLYRRGRKLARIGGTEERFTHIYERNKWKNVESRSGAGSTLEYTENIRREIPRLLRDFGIATMLDAPCGDYHWFRHVDRPGVAYVGGDIVRALVDRNQQEFGDDDTRFVHLDITRDSLPAADLWMCRDCFIHLSFELIDAALRNFERSRIRYLLVSTYPDVTRNDDIPTGHARNLNLLLPPFGFGAPLTTIDDSIEGFDRRVLGLWEGGKIYG